VLLSRAKWLSPAPVFFLCLLHYMHITWCASTFNIFKLWILRYACIRVMPYVTVLRTCYNKYCVRLGRITGETDQHRFAYFNFLLTLTIYFNWNTMISTSKLTYYSNDLSMTPLATSTNFSSRKKLFFNVRHNKYKFSSLPARHKLCLDIIYLSQRLCSA